MQYVLLIFIICILSPNTDTNTNDYTHCYIGSTVPIWSFIKPGRWKSILCSIGFNKDYFIIKKIFH